MAYETINTQVAMNWLRELMQPNSQKKMLRLEGVGNIGKSHLLTKVFPEIIRQEFSARLAIIDMQNPALTIRDFLDIACSQLGNQSFIQYNAAYQAWIAQPKVGITKLLAIFSRINISAKDSQYDPYEGERYLTKQFVNDLSKLDDKLLLLIFDSVDCSNNSFKTWLIDTFLALLSSLEHVRIVIAARSLPKASGSYELYCKDEELMPITEVEAYITYCQ